MFAVQVRGPPRQPFHQPSPKTEDMNDQEKLRHFAQICLAAAEGKPIEIFCDSVNESVRGYIPANLESCTWRDANNLRIKPEWKLPDPPEGRKWHRQMDWKEGMLLDGERPLLEGEYYRVGDLFLDGRNWEISDCSGGPACDAHLLHKTKRPLPGQEIAPGHNPHKLTVAQVGEGWRLLDEDEVKYWGKKWIPHTRLWIEQTKQWSEVDNKLGWMAGSDRFLSTRLTREELAALDKPKMRAWSDQEDVPLNCWISAEHGAHFLVTEVHIGGVVAGRYLTWKELGRARYSTDRVTWQPCTVNESR